MINRVINNITKVERNISAYSPSLGRIDFTSQAKTFGELKRELISRGYDIDNYKITEGVTQVTLERDEAILPTNINFRGNITNDLVIIMTPKARPKSGSSTIESMGRIEIFEVIKALKNSPDTHTAEIAKDVFYRYTNKSTEVLKNLLTENFDLEYADEEVCCQGCSNGELGSEGWAGNSDEVLMKLTPTQKALLDAVDEVIKKFIPDTKEINLNEYTDAIDHILYGVSLLQNNVLPTVKADLPTLEDILEMAKNIK